MNVWQSIKEYVNSKKIGDTIYRKDIIYHVYTGPMPARYRAAYGSTLDNYRLLLTKLGILEHTRRGVYKVRHYIRNDLTTSQLKLLVDNGMTLEKGS